MSSDSYATLGGTETRVTASRDLCEALTSPRRRAIYAILRGRRQPRSVSDLATELVAHEQEISLLEVSRTRHQAITSSLRHHHLPTLADSGIIVWNREDDTVRLAPNAPIPAENLAVRIASTPSRQLNRLFSVLANGRRRTIISVLMGGAVDTSTSNASTSTSSTNTSSASATVATTVLARQVIAAELGCHPTAVSDADCDRVRVSLHHSHLPAMDAAGLVEYDHETKSVRYEGHPLLVDCYPLN